MDLIAKAVTLKSIKLSDPTANKLLFSAKHSVLYLFDSQSSSWEKTETEGCLAIYKRTNSTETVLFILNRLAPENFSCSLLDIESVQLEGDLLMLLNRDSRVMGIWLFDEKERLVALQVLETILSGAEDSSSDSDSQSPRHLKPISVNDLLHTVNKQEKTPNILDLLSKAKVREDQECIKGSHAFSNSIDSLDSAILDHFTSSPLQPVTSLKSFTSAVCTFLQENPQLLAALHRKLAENQNK